jgi:hypothetical protein
MWYGTRQDSTPARLHRVSALTCGFVAQWKHSDGPGDPAEGIRTRARYQREERCSSSVTSSLPAQRVGVEGWA